MTACGPIAPSMAAAPGEPMTHVTRSPANRGRILCVDDSPGIVALVQDALGDEGYEVSRLTEFSDEALVAAIDRIKPDCVLLDSATSTSFERSWQTAASIRRRRPSVAVVMFSAHVADSVEAAANLSERARLADFAAVLLKPFHLDELLAAVSTAMASSVAARTTHGGGHDAG